jgi:peptide/nickel transport system ATP-binding protein/oligopeptide transport system ATP-binding protein
MANAQTVLDVDDLTVRFDTQDGAVHAVNNVSFTLRKGEFLGVVGESGSGKSVTMMSLLRLIPIPPGKVVSGSALLGDDDLVAMDDQSLRGVRGRRVGFVFQDPMTSLNPVLRVGYQISETLILHRDLDEKAAWARAGELLALVGISDPKARLRAYPHELSGGMRQRVMIAIALACDPEILIADEPTTALDVTIQAQIIEVVKEIRDRLGTSVIWITHDLGVVASLADRVIVMYGGQIVEEGPVSEIYGNPQHPYTRALLASVPRVDQKGATLSAIKGQPPNMVAEPTSCSFAPRCPYAFDRCLQENPALIQIGAEHRAACWWDLEKNEPR